MLVIERTDSRPLHIRVTGPTGGIDAWCLEEHFSAFLKGYDVGISLARCASDEGSEYAREQLVYANEADQDAYRNGITAGLSFANR